MTWPHSHPARYNRIRVRCEHCHRMVGINGLGSHLRVCLEDRPAPIDRVPSCHVLCDCGSGLYRRVGAQCCTACEHFDERMRELNAILGIGRPEVRA
jgi:hypothetical protein